MNWRDRTAQILGNAAIPVPPKPPKGPAEAQEGLLSALSGPDSALSHVLEGEDKDPAQDAIDERCRYVLAMLDRDPTSTRATKVYDGVDPDNVIIATARRGCWYVEMLVAKPLDPYAFISMPLRDEVH